VGVKTASQRGAHDGGMRGKRAQTVSEVGGKHVSRRGEREAGEKDVGEHGTDACGEEIAGGNAVSRRGAVATGGHDAGTTSPLELQRAADCMDCMDCPTGFPSHVLQLQPNSSLSTTNFALGHEQEAVEATSFNGPPNLKF
jgi:hypothetical protein